MEKDVDNYFERNYQNRLHTLLGQSPEHLLCPKSGVLTQEDFTGLPVLCELSGILSQEDFSEDLPYEEYVKEKLVDIAGGGVLCKLCGSQQKYRRNIRRHYLQAHSDS